MRYISSFFIFSFYVYGFNYHLKPYTISKGIDCFFGLPSQVNKINGGNMINSCYIETSEGYVVIDSGPTYTYAQEAYEVMKKKKKLPVKYVINTSWSEVHVLGNQFYKELGAKILAPKGYKKYFENKKTLSLEKEISKGAFVNTRIVAIDKYIEEEETLTFLKMKLKINVLKGGGNYLYVHVKEKDIIFAGDIIFNNRIVPIKNGRSAKIWLKEIEKIEKLQWVDIISSHGYMTRRSALTNTKSYLSLLQGEILKQIKKNESRENIIKNVKLASFKNMKFYTIWHSENVAKVYDELIESIKKDKPKNNNSKEKNFTSVVVPLKIKKVTNNKTIIEQIAITKKIELKYKKFEEAMQMAKNNNKIVLIKVRSTICKYCDQLENIFIDNLKVKKLVNKYFELVVINMDNEELPLQLRVQTTPTLIFIRPDNKKVLMQLAGIRALGELLKILNEAIDDGHAGEYLRP